MHDYKKLDVWNHSIDFSVKIYAITSDFPEGEKFGLVSQIRRSAVSIASNIAEGAGRGTEKEFGYFLSVALGSAYELETQLILSSRLQFINNTVIENLLVELESICKMIFSLRKSRLKV